MRFGHKWLSLIDDDDLLDLAIADWRQQLGGLAETDLLYGLSVMDCEWPPSSTEFRRICDGREENWRHATAAYKPFDRSRALELKPNKEVAKAALSEIRNTLRA